MARRYLYEVRAADPDFAADWDDARQEYADALETVADRRAVEGYVKQVIVPPNGPPIELRAYSDVLLMFRLKALRPEQYKDRGTLEHTGPNGGPLQIELVEYADPADPV